MLNTPSSEPSVRVIPFGACLVLLLAPVAFCIAEIVISVKYSDDSSNECHDGKLLRPVVWMLWDGITGLIVLGAFAVVMVNKYSERFEFIPLVYTLARLVMILNLAFSIAWGVIGGVVLWRDNDPPCGPGQLHDAMYSFVIIDIVMVGLSILTVVDS